IRLTGPRTRLASPPQEAARPLAGCAHPVAALPGALLGALVVVGDLVERDRPPGRVEHGALREPLAFLAGSVDRSGVDEERAARADERGAGVQRALRNPMARHLEDPLLVRVAEEADARARQLPAHPVVVLGDAIRGADVLAHVAKAGVDKHH